MEVKNVVGRRVRCDVLGCKNNATYALIVNEGGKRTFFCERCAGLISKAVAADTTPESPTSVFLRREKTTRAKDVKGDA